jgi:hypothetical protein
MAKKWHWERMFVPVPQFSPVSVILLVLHVHFSTTSALQPQKLTQPSNKTRSRVSMTRCCRFAAN